MNRPPNQRCEGCVLFDDEGQDDPLGLCRKDTPKLVTIEDEQGTRHIGAWPLVTKFDWCGNYNPRSTGGARGR
jgi:hypothetical protein